MARPIVSADSHVVEPPDLWVKHIDPRYKDRAPKVVKGPDQDYFALEGFDPTPVAPIGTPFFRKEAMGTRFEEGQKGGWDPDARVREMALDGVLAEVLYPSLAMRMYAIADPGMQAACLRAYNDWLAEFSGAHPDRLYGVALIPLLEIETGIAELHRARKMGLAGASIWIDPGEEYTFADSRYDLFWGEAEKLRVPISMHAFTSRARTLQKKTFIANYSCAHHSIQQSLAILLFAGVLERFPGLSLISVENDIGWVGHLMQRMDHVYQRKGPRWGSKFTSGLLPSEQLQRNIRATFMEDRVGLLNLPITGDEVPMWASDYPHDDSTWPRSREIMEEMFQGVPPRSTDKIVYSNAINLYGMKVIA